MPRAGLGGGGASSEARKGSREGGPAEASERTCMKSSLPAAKAGEKKTELKPLGTAYGPAFSSAPAAAGLEGAGPRGETPRGPPTPAERSDAGLGSLDRGKSADDEGCAVQGEEDEPPPLETRPRLDTLGGELLNEVSTLPVIDCCRSEGEVGPGEDEANPVPSLATRGCWGANPAPTAWVPRVRLVISCTALLRLKTIEEAPPLNAAPTARAGASENPVA